MSRFLAASSLALILSFPAGADATGTKPVEYTWIVSSCPTWNCAAAALVLAGGDKHVMVLPTGREERPWLVLKRVESGAIYIPDDEPFTCEVFETATAATARFDSVDACHAPMVLSVPDGRAVVTMAIQCPPTTKRRATRGQ